MDDLEKYIEERDKKEPGFKQSVEKKREERERRNKAGRAQKVFFTADWH